MKWISTLFLALLLSLSSASEASAQQKRGLELCNRDEDNADYLVAVIIRWPLFLQEQWESAGWYRLEPGRCMTWNKGQVNTTYYLSISKETRKGWSVTDYGLDKLPKTFWGTKTYGIEQFHCVASSSFQRRGEALSDFDRCRAGEYKQLFNLLIFVEHDSNFTLSLT